MADIPPPAQQDFFNLKLTIGGQDLHFFSSFYSLFCDILHLMEIGGIFRPSNSLADCTK